MECWRAPGCRVDEDRKDALAVATQLELPYQVLDFKKAYRARVVETMFQFYQQGLTPNPDVLCNLEIKFGLFYDWALEQGFDAIATGHYARTIKHQGVSRLAIPSDTHKDQTYFLYQVPVGHISKVIFPLQDLTKAEVRQMAQSHNLPVAQKADSQGICFIGELDMQSFLKEHLVSEPGAVVLPLSDEAAQRIKNGQLKYRQSTKLLQLTPEGLVVGTHPGLAFLTIGQKAGAYIDGRILKRASQEELISFTPETLPELFVISKQPKSKTLVIGQDDACYSSHCRLTNLIWHQEVPDQALARIRHGGTLEPVRLQEDQGEMEILFEKKVRALAPGQSVVLYSAAGLVVGGGVIKEY